MLTDDSNQLRILAALLGMPAGDALDALRDMRASAPWLDASLPELEQTPLDRWQAEHTRLFLSGYPKTPCPPFESAYRQGTMGGTTSGDVEEFYRRVGLRSSDAPADYLGTMLECAAYLQEQGADDLLQELAEEHLEHWLPRFAQDLENNAEITLYRELGVQLGLLFPASAHA